MNKKKSGASRYFTYFYFYISGVNLRLPNKLNIRLGVKSKHYLLRNTLAYCDKEIVGTEKRF